MQEVSWLNLAFYHVGKQPAAILAITRVKRLAGVTPEANLRECMSCMPQPSANKAAHSGFETQRRCHQKVSVVQQKRTYVLQKKLQLLLVTTFISCNMKTNAVVIFCLF